MNKTAMPSILFLLIFSMFFITPASAQIAAGLPGLYETNTNVTAIADRINWYSSERHNVTVNYTGFNSIHADFIFPSGWSVIFNGTNCANNSGLNVSCNLSKGIDGTPSGTFVVASPTSAPPALYNVTEIKAVINGSPTTGDTSNSMKFLRIRDAEIFYTLIEYGRGRGNYFVNTRANDTDGTRSGYPFIPNETTIELNYLHKIFNIRQYLGLAPSKSSNAYNATFTCIYPSDAVVRTHLVTNITRTSIWNASYKVEEIEGSFERMGFLGQAVQNGSYATDGTLTINCTTIKYALPDAGGNVSINNNGITLVVKKKYPFTIQANSTPNPIGTGTQEILVNYTINNTEMFPLEDVTIDISAPPYAQFVGVRGELFGEATRFYSFHRTRWNANGTETIILVARFNTTGITATSLNVTGPEGVRISFIAPWDANAYNPFKTVQVIQQSSQNGVLPVDTALTPAIVGVLDELRTIRLASLNINATITGLNNTINIINTTLFTVNTTLNRLNSTVAEINVTLINVRDTDYAINATLAGINNTIRIINGTINQVNTTVTEIRTIDLNINATVTYINATVNYINSTALSQVNATNIINNITDARDKLVQNISFSINVTMNQTSAILTDIRRLKEFDEELVFLVTDSFGLQQQAAQEASSGETSAALQSLAEANDKLKAAAERLAELQNREQSNLGAASAPSVDITASLMNILTIAVLVLCIGAYFYFTRPHGKNAVVITKPAPQS